MKPVLFNGKLYSIRFHYGVVSKERRFVALSQVLNWARTQIKPELEAEHEGITWAQRKLQSKLREATSCEIWSIPQDTYASIKLRPAIEASATVVKHPKDKSDRNIARDAAFAAVLGVMTQNGWDAVLIKWLLAAYQNRRKANSGIGQPVKAEE